MSTKKQIVFPMLVKLMEQVGKNIKLARKRRKLTTIQVAEGDGIAAQRYISLKKGDTSVAFGTYLNLLPVLGLQDDIWHLAANDDLGRKLQDLELLK
jgi:transcriptional regulator with XRE-family HTH domain